MKGVYLSGKQIHDNPNSLQKAADKIKTGEEATKLKAMQSIVNPMNKPLEECIEAIKVQFSEVTRVNLTNQKTVTAKMTAKLTRYLDREMQRGNITSQNKADVLLKWKWGSTIEESLTKVLGKESIKNNLFYVHLQKEVKAFRLSESSLNAFQKDLLNLVRSLAKSQPEDAASANTEFIKDLRKLLASDVYQALKEDPTDPSIRFIHQLCSGIWNNVHALPHYKELGSRMLQGIDGMQSEDKVLKESWLKGAEQLYTGEGSNQFSYMVNSVNSAWGAFKSQNLMGTFDSHGELSNNPSLQGVTTAQLKNTNVKIHNAYGGSPTVGTELSPEFLAVLQAAENNQFVIAEQRVEGIPDIVTYTNFQQMSGSEGTRSQAIMMANELYPLSFSGITLTKDSSFYTMHHEKKREGLQIWQPFDFGIAMKEQLMEETSFRLESQYSRQQGFHFPGGKEKWEPVFDAIIQEANAQFEPIEKNKPLTQEEMFKYKAAYQEFVYSLIQGYQEMEAASRIKGRSDVLAMSIRASEENVDRGGAENTKYMYTRLADDHPDRLDLLAGAFHSRALSVRNRLIFEHRIDHLFAFMEHVKPMDFRSRQENLLKNLLGVAQAPNYVPVLQ